MVDKYGTDGDPSCYPGTSTLINLLNIQDANELEDAERDITLLNATEIEFSPPPYNLDYLCKIHKTLFQDIYAWAGEVRDIDISKENTRFCNVNRVIPEAEKLFSKLAQLDYLENTERSSLIQLIAEYYGEINMLHPFREGNGRTQRILFEHLIINTGHKISWSNITREDWLKANIASVYCDYSLLESIFDNCIGARIENQ